MSPAGVRMKANPPNPSHLSGKVIYLLILVVLVQFLYPVTASGTLLIMLIYQLFYASLLVVGIVVARDHPWLVRLLTLLGITWLVTGTLYSFNQDALWAQLLGYGVLILFQAVIIQTLLRFVFRAQVVDREVLYAASAAYLLLGALFVSAFGLVETLTYANTGQHAFIDSQAATGESFPWQHFVYYSYVTLTTLGYGDILPVTMWARSLVSLEAVIGVLYVTVIMARLVGLYAAGDVASE